MGAKTDGEAAMKKAMTALDFVPYKRDKRKISMVTCYDFWSARILNKTPIDTILVGDSAGMVMHGFSNTVPVTNEMMAYHVASVAKGAPDKFIVGDLPFLAFRKSMTENMNAVHSLMANGAHAVKFEGLRGNEEFLKHCVQSGVPVIPHLGLTPQFVNIFGGFKVQGKSEDAKSAILEDALKIEELGATALVLECIPAPLATEISKKLTIPTIGIGAGIECDGQVLVLHDLLGMNKEFKPRFVRQYLQGEDLISDAISKYHHDVVEGVFPAEGETFT
jgi:3-methyl-2-oxobutanoate hydroxymethyltransferase